MDSRRHGGEKEMCAELGDTLTPSTSIHHREFARSVPGPYRRRQRRSRSSTQVVENKSSKQQRMSLY